MNEDTRQLTGSAADQLTDVVTELQSIDRVIADSRSDTRERLLGAAVDLFAQHGFEASTVRRIAEAAGIKPPGVYAHFASKEAILAAAMARTMSTFLEFVVQPSRLDQTAEDRLEGVVRRHVLYQIANASVAKSSDLLLNNRAVSGLLSESDGLVIERARGLYTDHVIELVSAARQFDEPIDAKVTSYAIITLCDRVTTWYRQGGALSSVDVADRYWSLVRGMLGPSDE